MINIYFLPIQIVLSFFLLFAFSRVILRFKDGAVGLGQLFFWSGLWILAFFTIFYPSFTDFWARLLGIGRGADAIIYASVAVLFYLIFRIHVLIEDLRHEITKLVRQVAISTYKQKNQGKEKSKTKRH